MLLGCLENGFYLAATKYGFDYYGSTKVVVQSSAIPCQLENGNPLEANTFSFDLCLIKYYGGGYILANVYWPHSHHNINDALKHNRAVQCVYNDFFCNIYKNIRIEARKLGTDGSLKQTYGLWPY
jgi:hypothetical protein